MVVPGTPFWIVRAMSASVPPCSHLLSVRSGPLPPRPAPPCQPLNRPRNSTWPSASAAASGAAGLSGSAFGDCPTASTPAQPSTIEAAAARSDHPLARADLDTAIVLSSRFWQEGLL